MPPPRNRNPLTESLLNSTHPPAYATFDNRSGFRGATDADDQENTSERGTEYHRTLRYVIVAITIVCCCTVSLPFLYKDHPSHQHHDMGRNHTAPAPIFTCSPCPPRPTCPICPTCPTCPTCPAYPTCPPEPTPPTCPPDWPPPPPSPFQKFNHVPQPGSTYVLTDSETGHVITYSNNGGAILTKYRSSPDQHWTCKEQDGWLGFSMTPPGQSTVYLGFMNPPTLRCTAPWIRFNEMFAVVKRTGWGYRVYLRDGEGLRPLGKDANGNLARVETSEIWWGFTKVDWEDNQAAQKENLDVV
ncbi:hypothetical protein AA313_de0203675 [Arthrobotrys entomopaga]|nr:hypothetical protein AA313_de0203675 [Arthrobotrys entomopaga]